MRECARKTWLPRGLRVESSTWGADGLYRAYVRSPASSCVLHPLAVRIHIYMCTCLLFLEERRLECFWIQVETWKFAIAPRLEASIQPSHSTVRQTLPMMHQSSICNCYVGNIGHLPILLTPQRRADKIRGLSEKRFDKSILPATSQHIDENG